MKDVLFCYNIHSVYLKNSTTLNVYSKKLIFTLRNSLIISSLGQHQAELSSVLSSDVTGGETVCHLSTSRSACLCPGSTEHPVRRVSGQAHTHPRRQHRQARRRKNGPRRGEGYRGLLSTQPQRHSGAFVGTKATVPSYSD